MDKFLSHFQVTPKVVVAECGMGLVLDGSPEVRACFQKILQAAG